MGLITLEEARAYVTGACATLSPVRSPVDQALGCVLAEDVHSAIEVPPFSNTAMDGYAVRAADTQGVPVTLAVVSTLPAGASPVGHFVGPGQAVRIMTGAPMPAGADAIVPVEHTQRSSPDAREVLVLQPAQPGDAVRPAGEDVATGQLVFPAGAVLTAGHLGMLSSIGHGRVSIHPRPRVGVLSTGDELVETGHTLGPGQIHDSNRHTLLALLAKAGCEPVDLGLAPDDEHAIDMAIGNGLAGCDALVTSGGVSMGDFDWVKVVLDRKSNGAMQWMQIAIKPAKPLAFGTVSGKPVFGLPGNPVSSMVSFELFARPALRKMAGHLEGTWTRPTVLGVADEPLRRTPDGKVHFARVRAEFGPDGRVHVRSSGGQASNLLRAMALANALAVLPDGPTIEAGGDVGVLLLD